MNFQAKHWAVMGALLASLATQLGGVHNWQETLTPGFVSGLIGMIATTLTALFVGRPGADAELDRAHENTKRALVGLPLNDSPIEAEPTKTTKTAERGVGTVDVD